MKQAPESEITLFAWVLRLLVWLGFSFAVWWWLGGAHYLLRVLSVCANVVMPSVFFDNLSSVTLVEGLSWKIITSLEVVTGEPGLVNAGEAGPAVILINQNDLLHTLLGFPLLWALLLSTPGRRTKRLVIGSLVLTVVAFLGMASLVWALLTVLVNHRTSAILSWGPPPFSVLARPFPEWVFHLSSFTCYVLILIAPIISPILIWIALCRRAVIRLVTRLRSGPRTAG